MRKKKTIWKKTISVVLSLVMAAGLFPAISKPLTVEAAGDDSASEWVAGKPAASNFATKDELIANYNMAYDNGIVKKVNFGNNMDKTSFEWYIAGYDFAAQKLVLFCDPAKPIGRTLFAKDEYKNATLIYGDGIDGEWEGTPPSQVCKNHYGSSKLRVFLKEIAENPQYFSNAEQELMANTKVYTEAKSSVVYYTNDKLYPAVGQWSQIGNYGGAVLFVGANSSSALYSGVPVRLDKIPDYSNGSGSFWLRQPNMSYSIQGYIAKRNSYWNSTSGSNSYYWSFDSNSWEGSDTDCSYRQQDIVPAFALNPTSILFASVAPVCTESVEYGYSTFSSNENMTLRMEDSKNYIRSTVSNTADTIKVEKNFDRGDLYLRVQGYCGKDNVEFSTCTKIEESGEFRLGDLVHYYASDDVDISKCRIWIETTYDNVTYAKMSKDISKPAVSAPVANIESGIYEFGQKVELHTETDGAEIYYTTDGSTPDMWTSELYRGPITLTESTQVKAYAVKYGMADSDVKIFSYRIKPHTHSWSSAWTSDSGGHWHECTAAGCTVTANSQKGSYAAHTEDGGTITTQPTAASAGVKTYKCSVCGYVMRTETLPATGGGTGGTDAKIQDAVKNLDVSADTLKITDKTVTARKTDGDITGSSFVKIQARASKTTSKSVKLTWNRVKGADGYLVYGNQCNSGGKKYSYKLLKTITKGTTKTYTQSKLKKGTSYKYMVCAYKLVDGQKITIAASKTIHAVTDGGKYGNAKSVKVNKTKVSIKKGKSYTIKASEVKKSKKLQKHRSICYESSNTKVATVSKKGVIKAKAKGSCTIYVYAQNGMYKAVKVTVK